MKERSIILFVIVTLFLNTSSIAQTVDNKIAFGLNGISTEYYGDYGNGFLRLDRIYSGFGVSLNRYITPSLDMGIQAGYGKYGYFSSISERFFGNKFDISLMGHYKFNNGYIFGKYDKLSPFIALGIGFASYSRASEYDYGENPTIITEGADLIIPVGLGLKYQFSESLAIQYQYLYNFTNHDFRDENRQIEFDLNNINDAYGSHIVSLILSFVTLQDKSCYCQ
jgi:opacity protein-like surface antigen